ALAEATKVHEWRTESGPVEGDAPLTPIQHWFFEQKMPDANHWNLTVLLEARFDLEQSSFGKIVGRLVEHHDALRMRFIQREGRWNAYYAAVETADIFRVVDLTAVPAEVQAAAISKEAERAQQSLDIANGPLLRVVWFELGDGKPARILIVIHHLVVDGVSLRILLEDLESCCRRILSGENLSLPAKTTSYRTWARQLLKSARQIPPSDLAFWRNMADLAKQDVGPLPLDNPNGSRARLHGAEVTVKLDPLNTRALLQEVGGAYRTRINDLLLAALAKAIGAWAQSPSVLVDVEGHGREALIADTDVTRTVGWFTSIYPVLLRDIDPLDDGNLIISVKEQLRRTPHNGFFYSLSQHLSEEQAPKIKAEILFNYLGQLDQALPADSLFAPAREPVGASMSPQSEFSHELEIVGEVADSCLQLHWRFSAARHSIESIERVASEWKRILQELINHCKNVTSNRFTPSDFPLATLGQSDIDRLTKDDPENIQDIYPLASMQRGLLLHTLLNPTSGVYLMQDVITLKADLNVAAFRQAWQQVLDGQSILRTSFYWATDEAPHQIVHKRVDLHLEVIDSRTQSTADRESMVRAILHDEIAAGLKLDRAPIMRMRLIRVTDDHWIYIRSHHHIMLDAWCLPLLLADFLRYYEAILAGRPEPTRVATPYSAYIDWLSRQDMSAAETYWRKALSGFRTPSFLAARRPVRDLAPDEVEVVDVDTQLSLADTAKLNDACRKHRLTISAFLQGAWALLMRHYLNRDEVLFGVTVAGRPAELDRVEEMAGVFINTLPFRVTIPSSARVIDWLHELLTQTTEMRQYEYAPLIDILKWSDIDAGEQLFDSFVVFENVPVNPALQREDLPIEVLGYSSRTHSNYPVNLSIVPHDMLKLKLTYNQTLLEADAAERMLAHYRLILERLIASPYTPLRDITLLSDEDRERLSVYWRGADRDYGSPVDLIARFEARAAETPSATAAACEGATLSYGALNARANIVAHALIAEGVGPETLVALLDARGLDFLVMILAVFKAGGAYLPLDPAHPDGRIAQVLRESGAPLLLAGRDGFDRARALCFAGEPANAATAPRILELAALEARGGAPGNPPRRHGPDNLAFVIYTSGSTGKPKGAMVEHRGMFNNLITKVPALGLTPNDVIAQTASQCFDISVWQFLTALAIGARVEICPDAISRDPQRLAQTIADRNVTILEAVPSMIRALLDAQDNERGDETPLAHLRWLLPCGEAFAPELCRRFMARYPQVRLLNAYGPAECSDDVSYHPIETPPPGDDLSVPIGRAVDNTQLYILDRWLEPAPLGVAGEICVAGVQVGRGYLKRPDLTAAAFLPDPYGPPGSRLYRTGDLGRYRADGVLDFLGRVDHQVKIRGHRIEPGEVEAALSTHPKLAAAAVVAREASQGVWRLVAYVVGDAAPDEMRRHLQQTLPDYMIPSAFIPLDALPLTPNGKVDRKALPAPDLAATLAKTYVAPRNEIEQKLAQIWADVLHVQTVGINDNFFELGGHSLLAMTLTERMRQNGLATTVRELFANPTLAQLATVLGSDADIPIPPNGVTPECSVITPDMLPLASFKQHEIDRIIATVPGGVANTQDIYPLTALQEGLLFHHLTAQDGDPYLMPLIMGFDSRERLDSFIHALNATVARHDILRTAIVWEGLCEPAQVVWRNAAVCVEDIEIASFDGDPVRCLLKRFDPRRYRLDIRQAPLLRAIAARDEANNRWLLLVIIHHMVSDHATDDALLKEIQLHLAGEEKLLPAPIPYRNFVARARAGTDIAESEIFFSKLLGDLSHPSFPFGLQDAKGDGSSIEEYAIDLDPSLVARLQKQARALGISMASLCHLAFALVVART
ncbi:MAG: amino acid adenylation domain-containing protein, partial [Methylocystis sp.]|nr:amino acid adenylation domain-containing protein [Methylocystis sp.]